MMKSFICALTLFAAVSAFGSTVSTPVFGTYKIDCPKQGDTYVSVLVTRTPEFSGTVASNLDGKITVKGEPAWVANKFVYATGTQPNHYYLKFTSGELEGAWYDIKGNDSSSLTVEIAEVELAKVAENDTFEIIPHWTMKTLFPDGANFSKNTVISYGSGATRLYKYNGFDEEGFGWDSEPGINLTPESSFYYRTIGNKGWNDGTNKNVDETLVEPGAVFCVTTNTKDDVCVVSGVIPMCATSFEVFTQSDANGSVPSQDIYVAIPSAVDITLSDLTASLIDSGILSPSKLINPGQGADKIYVYSNVKEGLNKSPDVTCYYRSIDNVIKQWWDGSRQNVDDLVLKAGTVLMLRKETTGSEFLARCKFVPKYLSK